LGYLEKLPIFPSITAADNPREWFSQLQYERLLKAVDKMVEDKVSVRFVPVTMEFKYLVTFMANSFLRPGDLKELKHKHIESVTSNGHTYLRISPAAGQLPPPVAGSKSPTLMP